MNTLILYTTRHGCTEKAVRILESRLKNEITLINLKNKGDINISQYDTVMIGGSIHAGQIQEVIKKFCQRYLDTLLKKRIGLFICCMEEGETAQKQFNEAFPKELRDYARATGFFGGEFDLQKMNVFERVIVKKVGHITESISKINPSAIDQFAKEML